MEIEIEQRGIGKLQTDMQIPASMKKFLLPHALAHQLTGEGLQAIFQLFSGKHFQVWYSRYASRVDTMLKGKANIPALEFRISLMNRLRSTWQAITQPALPAYYYQFGFLPYMLSEVYFDADTEYETLDIHLELDFLYEFGLQYHVFEEIARFVQSSQPADLTGGARRCPPLMTDAVFAILNNNYSAQAHARLLRNNVENILIAALEDMYVTGKALSPLTRAQVDALHHVKILIEQALPKYPGNKYLGRGSGLNLFTLNFGFKRLFNMTPYEYYSLLRMARAKDLLLQGTAISQIAYELEFATGQAFSKAFKERFGIRPKDYQANGNKQ